MVNVVLERMFRNKIFYFLAADYQGEKYWRLEKEKKMLKFPSVLVA